MKLGLLIFFAANTLAAPFWVLDKDLPRAEVKDVGCKASRLRQGLDYTYDYEGETLNKIDGVSTQATGLKLKAQITITPLDECKFYMKISKTELLQKSMSQDSFVKSADSENFKIALEKYDLVFSMSENQITKLFSNKDEPVYILNTKRGILSTIQLEESVSVESDVNGFCKTTITQEDGKIVKSKKLSDCSQRTIQEIGFHAATIKSESDLKVLDSNSKCVYKISGNIINSVSCEETHLFKPFSAGHKAPSGAVTTVKQTLSNLQESKASSITSKIIDGKMQESSILYDHTSEENQAIKSLKDEFEETIQRLAKPNEVKQFTVKMDSAHEFSTMVFLLRKMDMKRMTIVWDKYFDCIESKLCDNSQVDLRDVYRQYLLDGIAYCGTSTCVTMVHDAIIKEAITGERMNIFLQSIALVATTSRKIIRDLMGIVSKQPTRQGYLTLGTILYRHCKKNIADCDDVKPNIITQAENFLIGKLGKNCEGQENYERVEEILMSLKALSNAQRPSRASSVILSCAANSEHVNITTAAFDAIGNMPCDKVIVDELYNFVKETSNAPNKRISAFVALMKCPNEILLEHVVDLLEQEPSNQLASFIWSYLTNIMESSNPKHESTKALLEKITKIKPLREFNMPFHQYSKAFEKSTYFQSIKSGAAIESHVIFNHENYFPQSAFFDLTANVLGVPVSLLETNIGIEGLEDLLEQAAGNDGFLSKNNFVFNLFNFNITAQKLRDLAQQREQQEPSVVRNRRATDEDSITELHKKVNRKNKLPNGHLSFKVMGQEIRTFSYDDIFYMVDQIDNMNVIQLLLNIAKGGSKTFTKSMMFLEMTQTVPTGLGLPLKLKLVGTTVAGIELNGKFDIRNMFWGPGSLTINGFVNPSAAVEISGQMGVDGHFVSSGVFVNSSMFVSNTIKGAIVYQEGKLLKINMDVPEEPVELFKIGSTPFMYLNGKNEAVEGVERKINPEETCFKSVMIGYGVCTSIRMPVSFREYEAPYFPLSGPAHFGVKLFRADEKLQTFQFLVSMTKKQPITSGVIEFSTPGALYERKLGGEFLFSDVDDIKTLTLSAKKSNKMASVEFSYNSVTHQTSVVGKNNFFTEKDIVTKFVFFNTSNTVNVNQIGLRFSTEYDWYKFESVTKLVKKETGFILTGSTLYYPTKSITGVLEYNSDEQKIITRVEVADKSFELTGNYQKKGNERGFTVVASSGNVMSTFYGGFLNEANKQEVLLSVNGFGSVLKNTYTYENVNGQRSFETKLLVNDHAAQLRSEFKFEGDGSELVLTADIFGKTAVSKFLVVNTASIKEVNVTANIAGNSGQASLKYLADGPSFVSSFDVMGSKLNAFVALDNSIGYKVIVGGSAGGYTAGLRNVYSQTEDTQSLCATLYYETMNLEKQAGIGCAKITSRNKEFIQRVVALTFTAGEGEKNVEFIIDFEKHTSQVKLNTDFKVNNNLLFNNRVTIKYNKLIDSEASVSYKVLNYDTGFKLFSKKYNEELQFGFETRVMKTSVLFLQHYSTVGENKEMKSEFFINDKVIPVNAQMNYIKNALEKKVVLRLTGGQYSIENFYSIFNNVNIYQLGSGVTVRKGESTIFNVYEAAAIQLNDKSKVFRFKFGAVLFEKTYEYGWETEYKNLGTSDKTSFSLVSSIQYAINRKSSISLTISNSKSDASAVVEFEYIPSNILIYSIKFNKVLYQVDASLEFLPKMFTKFMARLEGQNGYQLITDGSVEWSGYKRSLGATYTYKHTNSELIVSSSIGKNLFFSFTHLKNSPKLVELTIVAFENNGKWISVFQNSHLQNQFVWNDKEIINIGTNMELDTKSFFFQISKGKEALMKLSKSFNDIGEKVTLNLPDVRNLISFDGKLEKDALRFKVFGKEEWISLNVEVNREKNTALASISVFNKTLSVTGLFPIDGVSLYVNPYFMNEFSLNAIYNPQERSINLNAKTVSRTVGVILRCDIQNMIASFQTFCNENKISLNVFVEKNSFISQFSISPKFTFQFVFDILNDDTLMFSTQTLNEGKPLTLTSVKYQLSKGFSQLALNWNQETASMIYQTVSPIIETFSNKSIQNSKMFVDYIYESAMGSKVSAMEFIDMMDKAYSEIDITLSQEKLKSLAVSSIQQLSEILKHALKEVVRSIDSLKNQLPELFQKLNNLKDQINIILRKVRESVVEINSDLEKNWKEVVIIVFEAISNITKSSQPVVVKAFELIRGFKVQGVTVEEFVLSQSKGIQYLTDYAMSASNNLTVLVSKLKEEYLVNRENILLFKIPYTNETMENVLAIIAEKGLELKNLIMELTLKLKNQIHDLNLQTYFEEMQIKLINFKIENKSIEEHIAILKNNVNIFILNDMQKVIQKIQSKTELYVNKVIKFLTPLMDHIKFVNAAVIKHFKPFLTKSANEVLQKASVIHIQDIEKFLREKWVMIEKILLPMLEPIQPFYIAMRKQISNFEVNNLESWLNMQKLRFEDYAKETVKARMNIDDQINLLNSAVKKISKATQEEIVRNIALSDIKKKEVVEFFVKKITEHEKLFSDILQQVKLLWNQLKSQCTELTSKSLKDVIDSLFINSSANQFKSNILSTAEELSKALKKLSEMDLTESIIKNANSSVQMSKLQMDSIIEEIVKQSKTINTTEIALKTVQMVQQLVADIYASALVLTTNLYSNMDPYLSKMANLEYKQLLTELKTYALNYSKEIHSFGNQIYNFSKETIYNDRLSNAYATYKVHLEVLYAHLSKIEVYKISKIDYNQIYDEYVVPLKQWCKELCREMKEKSELVYDDVEGPSKKLFIYYKSIVTGFVTESYNAVLDQASEFFKTLISELNIAWNKIQVQLKEVSAKLYATYQHLLTQYEDMTWEEIIQVVCAHGRMIAKETQMNTIKLYNNLLKLSNVLKDEIEKTYIMTATHFNLYLTNIQSKVQPEVIKMVFKFKIFIGKRIADIKRIINEISKFIQNQASEIKDQVIVVYNVNKNKSLKKIYSEVTAMTVTEFNKQYELFEENVNGLKNTVIQTLQNFSHNYYTKANVLLQTVIIPELVAESESFINQTLRLSVILANETVNAYSPHFYLITDILSKFTEEMKTKVLDLSEEVSKRNSIVLEENLTKLQNILNNFSTKLQNNDIVVQTINHEYVKQSSIEFKKLKETVELKMNELKLNPTEEYKLQTEQALNKIQEYFEELKKYYSEQFNIDEIIVLIQNVRESGIFTLNKATQKLKPGYNAIVAETWATVKRVFGEMNKVATLFRQYPEETFWKTLSVAKGNIQSIISIDLLEINTKYSRWLLEIKEDDYFNEWTKTSIKKAVKYAQSTSESLEMKIKDLISYTKTTVSFYQENVKQITNWYNNQMSLLPEKWSKCPISSIFANPLWNNLKNELTNHELFVVARMIAGKGQDKFVDIKDMALAEFNNKNNDLNTQVFDRYHQTKGITLNQYKELAENYNHLIKKVDERYQELVSQTLKTLDDTTLSDVVLFVQTSTNQMVEKLLEVKKMFDDVQLKGRALYNEYSNSFIAQFENYKLNAITIFDQYQIKVTNLCTQLHTELYVYFTQYKQTLVPYYASLEATVQQYYHEFYPLVVGKYNDVYLKVKSQLDGITLKSKQVFNEFIKNTIDMTDLVYSESYSQWMQSDLHVTLVSLRKMTIKETVSALLRLPSQIKKVIITSYNKYQKNILELSEKVPKVFSQLYNNYYNTCHHFCSIMYKSMNENYNLVYKNMITAKNHYHSMYKEVLVQFDENKNDLVKLVKPFVASSLSMITWVKNEITESTLFFYQYYHLDEKFKTYRDLLFSEYKNIIPTFNEYKEVILKVSEEYKDVALKITQEYKDKVLIYTKEYREQAKIVFQKCKEIVTKYIHKYQPIAEKFMGQYIEHTRQYVKEYQAIALRYYKKIKEQAPLIALKYRDMVQHYINEYQATALKYYDEIKEHVPVIVLKYIDMTQQYIKEYQATALMYYKEFKEHVPEIALRYKDMAQQYAKEYQVIALQYYEEIKEQAPKIALKYRDMAQQYANEYQVIALKYYEEIKEQAPKIALKYKDMAQQYANEYQVIALKYYEEIKEQAPKIALKYRDMAQQYANEYQVIALKYYEEIKEQAPKIALKYRDMAQQYANEYQVIALKYYEEIKEQAPKIALKYKDMAQQYANEYQVIALKYYEEIKEQAPKIALKYRDMAQQYANEYQVIALKYYEEIKEQAPKIALKYRDMAQQYANEYQVIALKYYEEIKEQAPKIALKYRDMAQQYANEYQVIALKYYEEIKEQAPKIALKYRDMAQQYANEYQVIALKYYEEIKEQAPKIALKYKDMAQQYAKEYQVIAFKYYDGEYKELIQKVAAEYKILVLKYYEEFAEQAPKVVAKYRALANRYIQEYQDVAEKLVAEYMEQIQKVVFPYKEMIVKFVKEYHPIVKKLIADYKNIAIELARKYILIAQNVIDESRKYINNFDLKNVKKDLDSVLSAYMTELGNYVSIESKKGKMLINVYHSEITPKFSHHLSSIGVRSRRSIESVKMKGSDLVLTIEKQFEELKARVQQLVTKIQYFLTNSKEVKTTLLASYYSNRKILETGIENGMQQLNAVYKNALNEFETIKIEANKFINNFSVAYYYEKSQKISTRFYSHAQTQSLEYYKQAKEFYSKYLDVAQKLLSEYFIIVEKYYSNYYTQVQEILIKYYNQAQNLYPEYYNQAKELCLRYRSQAQEFSLKFYNQAEVLYSQYYSQAKEFSMKYYNQAKKLYPEYYDQVKELYLKYYSQAQKFSLKHYQQAQNLYLEYYNQAKEFSINYYNQIEKLHPEYFNQAKELSLKYYGQVQKLYSEYYNKAKEFSIKYYNQAAKSYPEYYNQARDLSLKYYEQAQKLYSEYYNQVKELSLKYYNQAMNSYPEYYNQASEFLLKYYNPAQKLYIEYHNQMKQFSLKYFTQVQDFSFLYINQSEKLYLEYYNQAKELSLKYYSQAKKLSPEYYDHVKQLSLKYYTQAQEISSNCFNQTQKLYSEYYNQVQEFSFKYYNLAQILYPEYYSKAKEFCLEYYNQSQKIYTEYKSQAKILYSDYYNQVQKLTSVNYDQINKFSLEYFKQAQDLSLKYYNQILSITIKCKNDAQEFYNKNINEAQTLYFDYYNQVQSLSLEYLNLTEKFYSESQKFSVENYEQALTIYSNYKKQVEMLYTELNKRAHMWSVTFYEKSNVELKKLFIRGNTLFSEFKKDPSAFLKSIYQKSIELFNFWSFKAENLYDQYQPKIVVMLKDHQTLFIAKANKLSKQITLIYNKLESKLNDWKSEVTPENLYVIFETVHKSLKETPIFLRAKAIKMYQLYQPKIASIFNQQKSLLTTNFVNLLKQIKITYSEFETAFNNWKSGVSAEKAFYQITRRFKHLTKYASYETLENIRQALCINHIETCQRFTESIQMQVTYIKSYITNIFKVVVSKEVALLQYVRNEFSFINDQKKSLMSSLATAIIFGNNHVITFDRKVYDFIDYNQRDCTYLLARDFVHGKFSIMRQSDTTIVNTPDMSIKIKNDGKTQATIGNKTINSLPVESESSKCVRLYDVIRCEFIEQGIFVSVDLINFVTTIQLSSWHFGKTQGVLGTYNHESYDDWKMPDGKIADNIYKFANAYEVSKKRSCVATPKEKACSNAPSAKCKELFNSTSSMFARFFKIADPKPFLKACEDDTSCKSIGHCSSVTAYRGLLKALGEKPDFCPDCVAFDSHKMNEEWNLKPTGSVDVVMLVSDRVSGKDFKKQLMKIMIQVQQFLRVNKYDTRYALIGFGGKGVHESSHIRPIGTGDIFGSSDDLLKEMKKMEFNGEDNSFNDAFEAITMASKLSFRPGASRIFILYTEDDVKSSLSGVTQIEAQHFLEKEANATLVVFQNLQTKMLAQQLKGNFIAETAHRVYSDKAPSGSQKGSYSLTNSAFKKLTDSSNGALFTTDFTSVNIVSKSLYDVMSFNIQRVNSQCQQCVVQAKPNGDPVVICATRNDITC
nr:uncharacterized protein LOC100199505 [Hydra vulgaris]